MTDRAAEAIMSAVRMSDQQREGAREEWSMPQTDFSAETVASFFLGVKSVLPIKEWGDRFRYSDFRITWHSLRIGKLTNEETVIV